MQPLLERLQACLMSHTIGGKGMMILDTDVGLILIADLLAGSVKGSI
jgi:hypothetical protein